jgi:hypothetical protein
MFGGTEAVDALKTALYEGSIWRRSKHACIVTRPRMPCVALEPNPPGRSCRKRQPAGRAGSAPPRAHS